MMSRITIHVRKTATKNHVIYIDHDTSDSSRGTKRGLVAVSASDDERTYSGLEFAKPVPEISQDILQPRYSRYQEATEGGSDIVECKVEQIEMLNRLNDSDAPQVWSECSQDHTHDKV